MCEKNQLNNILSEVQKHAEALFGDKLVSVMLYGSYARGDYDNESDIDIMVLADIDASDIVDSLSRLRDGVYKLEIEHDCVLSLCVTPNNNFERYKNVSPFYRNVLREGISFAG